MNTTEEIEGIIEDLIGAIKDNNNALIDKVKQSLYSQIESYKSWSYDKGRDKGYSQGHDEGRDDGYDEGYEDGKADAYEDGYEDAKSDLELKYETLSQGLGDLVDAMDKESNLSDAGLNSLKKAKDTLFFNRR